VCRRSIPTHRRHGVIRYSGISPVHFVHTNMLYTILYSYRAWGFLRELQFPCSLDSHVKNSGNSTIWFNSVAVVRERTIPTERPPLVGEVSANVCGYRVPRGQSGGTLRPYSRFSRPEPLLFLSSSSSVVLTRLSGPRSRPTTSQKIR
jgi:hypothetical protein